MNADAPASLPPGLSAYTWRPIRRDDAPAIQRMLAAAGVVDKSEPTPSEERLRQLLGMLEDQIDRNTLIALTADGTAVATAMVFIPSGEDEKVAMTNGAVHVDHRGQGVGSYILQWMEARARQEFGSPDDGVPRTIRTSCTRHQADRIALFEERGFKPARHSYTMQRSLTQPISAYPLPDGLRLVRWTPELDATVMDAFNDAFSDHWGLQRMTAESWRQSFTGVTQFRGDLTYLTMNGGAIAGFCVNWVNGAANADIRAREGWVEAIGVVPAYRGRGIASALLDNALRLFQAEGLERAALDVDAENPTGALRLYEKHGFEVAKETILFVKDLSGD